MGTADMGIRANVFSGALPLERGGNGDTQESSCKGPPYGGLPGAEGLLVTEPEPPMGAHIVTERRGYTHHGIYVGAGQVVHYAGLSRGLRRGPVEEISLSRFAAGHRVRVVSGAPSKFDGWEVVRRARSRIGEHNYRLLTNNCEHLCEWCLRGQHRSYQIDACLALPARALELTQRLIAQLPSLAGRTGLRSSRAPATNPC
jgi:hypothetical protein